MEELKPVEKLYLISKEDNSYYIKKNILYSLIYQLIESKNIIVKNNRFDISFIGDHFIAEYEERFLQLINNNKYLELDNFISTISFDRTLINHKFLEESIVNGKVFFIISVPKSELKKTVRYYETQAIFKRELDNSPNILKVVCPNLEKQKEVIFVYNLLAQSMQKAQEETIKKEKENNNNDFGNLFGINEK